MSVSRPGPAGLRWRRLGQSDWATGRRSPTSSLSAWCWLSSEDNAARRRLGAAP